jgi:predicted Zn-dependent protease
MAVDINPLLRRAEQALVGGRLDSARADLNEARRLAGDLPAILHLTALVEKKSGNAAAAQRAFAAALRLTPNDAQLNMNYGNLLQAMGDAPSALAHYDRALALAPSSIEARFNRALLLPALGRLDEALAELDALIAKRPSEALFHRTRGTVLRAAGRLSEAADAFDRAVALDPNGLVALHGRARIAFERGEDDAAAKFAAALSAHPGHRDLLLGHAEALEAEGRAAEAIPTLEMAVSDDPNWIEGQTVLARIRWEATGDRTFTRNLEAAVAAQSGNPALWDALAGTLAAADLAADAAKAAAEGVRATGGEPRLRLLEAFLTSEAGDTERADRLFAALPDGLPDRHFSEARHALRSRRFDQASQLLDQAREESPWDVAVWAMTSLAWRLSGDSRADWLNAQPGLVGTLELELDDDDIAAVVERLRALHRTRTHPLHQSLRGGTQTRGRLFERTEPEIVMFAGKICGAVERYWADLPAEDDAHPLLRHRGARPVIEGSWSVRLSEGGFHVAHFHPEGVVSSATYLVVPEPKAPMEGWLEIGAAPAELPLALEPLHRVDPAPGRLALFPSYLFHGTRPFSQGERLTVAFDVVA